MKKWWFPGLIAAVGLLFQMSALSGTAAGQADKLSGPFTFLQDTDGGKPPAGAFITITFAGGNVVFSSVGAGAPQTDKGVYSIQGNTITIHFDKLALGCSGKVFIFDGESLSLPFKVLSPGEGYSLWKKSGGDGTTGSSGQNGRPGRDGRDVDDGKGKIGSESELEGDWGGKGAGAEVRFRREATLGQGKFNVMTLTTKHATEFFFHVFPDQHIEGEGDIVYNLEPNLSGVDALAGAVKSMLGFAMVPTAPGGGSGGKLAEGMAAGTLNAPGVTSLSYSYKMKDAPQQRHFVIRGKVYKEQHDLYKVHLEVSGDYFRSADLSDPDNKLWVEYEVNLNKDTKSFPTWSPFLTSPEGDAIIRESSGGTITVAESNYSGTHRDGVKPWQEYTFSWTARKVNQ